MSMCVCLIERDKILIEPVANVHYEYTVCLIRMSESGSG